jgi:hypothetical protein
MVDAVGIGPERRAVTCRGLGLSATAAAVVLSMLGHPAVSVDDGGWAEWDGAAPPQPSRDGWAFHADGRAAGEPVGGCAARRWSRRKRSSSGTIASHSSAPNQTAAAGLPVTSSR